MELRFWEIYLLAVNVLGFILFKVNTWLYSHTANKQIDSLLTVTSILGGSAGILLSIILFDRKAQKGNMMSRVFVICVFIIQTILFSISKGYISDNITLSFSSFFNNHKFLLVYFIIINFITFFVFAIDKFAAIDHRSRIRIVTLLTLSFLGGSIGGLLAMYIFRHKIRKDYFSVGIPLIILTQAIIIFYFMNISF